MLYGEVIMGRWDLEFFISGEIHGSGINLKKLKPAAESVKRKKLLMVELRIRENSVDPPLR